MKILTASVALAITLGLYGLTPAMAGSFNDKSFLEFPGSWPTTVERYDQSSDERRMTLSPPSDANRSQGAYCEITVPSLGFNEAVTAQRTC